MTGFDANSTVREYEGKDTSYALPDLRDGTGRPVGANVKPQLRVGPAEDAAAMPKSDQQ